MTYRNLNVNELIEAIEESVEYIDVLVPNKLQWDITPQIAAVSVINPKYLMKILRKLTSE